MNLPLINKLSPSSLIEYLSCPRKFKYNKIDKIEQELDLTNIDLEFGSAVHKVMEKIHNFVKLKSKMPTKINVANAFEEIFIEELKKNRKLIPENFNLIEQMRRKGVLVLCTYIDNFPNEEVIATELELTYEIDGVTITNIVDCILPGTEDYFDNTSVIIRDYKTANNPYKDEEILSNLQLLSYAKAVEVNYPKYKVQGVEYFVLLKTGKLQRLYLPLMEGWREDFDDQVIQIIKGIQAGIYPKNPIPKAYKCNTCPFFEYCWKSSKDNNLVQEQYYG